jgi:hypothetical protein
MKINHLATLDTTETKQKPFFSGSRKLQVCKPAYMFSFLAKKTFDKKISKV